MQKRKKKWTSSLTCGTISDSLMYMQLWPQKEKRKIDERKKFEIITDNFSKFVKDYKSADSRISTNSKRDKRLCAQSWSTLLQPPWAIACQAPPWDFPRQEYWSKLPFPPPGDLFDPVIEPTVSCVSFFGRQLLHY